MDFPAILKRLRRGIGYTQPQVAEVFCKKGMPLTNKAISKWEKGDSKPDAVQFLTLCELYNVRDVLDVFLAKRPLDDFKALNDEGKKLAREYIHLLAGNNTYGAAAPAAQTPHRTIPLYDLPVSAGTGMFLDGDHYELIDADESVPLTATFAVRVRGDSMTPYFEDQQIIFVKQQQTLQNGDYGVFMLNGDAYCKKLSGNALLSLNPAYEPITIGEDDDFRIIGKVIG